MPEKTKEQLEAEKQELEQKSKENEQKAAEAAKKEAEKQGLSEEEVQSRVEKARKEEKDKLYPKIEELTQTVKFLQDHVRKEQEEKEKIKKEADAQAEKERVAKLSADERQAEILNRLEEQLNREREERAKFKLELEQRDSRDRVKRYRERAIQDAGDEIIPELVIGESEAEIDTAIENAKAKYKEIIAKEKERQGQTVRDNLSSTSPNTEALEEEELKERGLASIDQDRYLADPEYRKDIQNRLVSVVQQAQGR